MKRCEGKRNEVKLRRNKRPGINSHRINVIVIWLVSLQVVVRLDRARGLRLLWLTTTLVVIDGIVVVENGIIIKVTTTHLRVHDIEAPTRPPRRDRRHLAVVGYITNRLGPRAILVIIEDQLLVAGQCLVTRPAVMRTVAVAEARM